MKRARYDVTKENVDAPNKAAPPIVRSGIRWAPLKEVEEKKTDSYSQGCEAYKAKEYAKAIAIFAKVTLSPSFIDMLY